MNDPDRTLHEPIACGRTSGPNEGQPTHTTESPHMHEFRTQDMRHWKFRLDLDLSCSSLPRIISAEAPVTMDESVRIVEVGPRDGLQNISRHVPTKTKIQLIQRLHAAGLENIELTSLVSPKAVPQLKDGQDVLKSPSVQSLLGDKSSRLPILVPNTRGAEIARKHGVSEVAVFVSATEGFSKANINCTVDEGIARAKAVAREAKAHGLAIRG